MRGLGSDWELPKLHYKPYPTNHFTHAGIDAALAFRADGVRPEDVEAVTLGVATPTLRTIAEPAEAKARPPSGYAAKFSGPFTFAIALAGGGGLGVSLEDFTDDRARDPELLALADRVKCVGNADCDAVFPHALPAVVQVRLKDGSMREQRVMENRGGPGRPLSEDELPAEVLIVRAVGWMRSAGRADGGRFVARRPRFGGGARRAYRAG